MPTSLAEKCVFHVGQFTFDLQRRIVRKNGKRLKVPEGTRNLLDVVLAEVGPLATKEDVVKAMWGDVRVDEAALARSDRETQAMLDYELAHLPKRPPRDPALTARLEALVKPHQAFIEGRALFEPFPSEAAERARQGFAEALRIDGTFAPAHVGLANLYLLRYEASRADIEPDKASLSLADHHGLQGLGLAPEWAESNATLGMVRRYTDSWINAMPGPIEATRFEPGEWRHHLRLAYVCSGDARVKAARRAQELGCKLTIANWLIATVWVAFGDLKLAAHVLGTACHLQDLQIKFGEGTPTPGLHLFHGQVLLALNDADGARAAWSRELATGDRGHVHGREALADTWYSIGALALREGKRDEAAAAFQRALMRVPGHGLAAVGLHAASGQTPQTPVHGGDAMTRAMVQAVIHSLQGKHRAAARICADALKDRNCFPSAWKVPIDPLLDATSHVEDWIATLVMVEASSR